MSERRHKRRGPMLWIAARPRRFWIRLALLVPMLYVSSYFVLGSHSTGENWVPRYTWHDREFPFDPWLYTPLAKIESKCRGPDVQVVLDGSPGRDGSATYIFWSGDPKF